MNLMLGDEVMPTLFRQFLEQYITVEISYEPFNYELDLNCSLELFYEELKKFWGLSISFFYNHNRLVTVLNSYEIHLKQNVVEHLFKMYLFAKKNHLNFEGTLILEFLYTYFSTINTIDYKKNHQSFANAKNEFKSVLTSIGLNKFFFRESIECIYPFYKKLLHYAVKKDIFVDFEIINRIFMNLNNYQQYYNELIEFLITNKKNLYGVILFDNDIEQHVETYLDYIEDSLSNFEKYNYSKEILLELDKAKCLSGKNIKVILNKYIDVVNFLCKKLSDKTSSCLHSISEIESLKNDLIFLLQNIKSLQKKHKEKIHQCLSYLLRLKRHLLSDEEYVNSEMKVSEFTYKISSKEIENFKNTLLNNKFSLYAASKVKFIKALGAAIETYSKYPLQSIVTRYRIDTDSQIYTVNIEEHTKKENSFKDYFDEKGREYISSHPKLMNKLSENYYEELLKYLSKSFIMQQELIIASLGYDNFRKIISELKESISYTFDNDYAIVICNILAIEAIMKKMLAQNNLNSQFYGRDDLDLLFKIYDEEEKKDGLMYLNYILYEKSGLNLRNAMMHGTMINSNLNVALLVTFSGLIFASWLLNENQ